MFKLRQGKLSNVLTGNATGFSLVDGLLFTHIDTTEQVVFHVVEASSSNTTSSTASDPAVKKQGIDFNYPTSVTSTGLASSNSEQQIYHIDSRQMSRFAIKNGVLDMSVSGSSEQFVLKDGLLWYRLGLRPRTVEALEATCDIVTGKLSAEITQYHFDKEAHQVTASGHINSDLSQKLNIGVYLNGLFPIVFKDGILFRHIPSQTSIASLNKGLLYRVTNNLRGMLTAARSTSGLIVTSKSGVLEPVQGGLGELYLSINPISAEARSLSFSNIEDCGQISVLAPKGFIFRKGLLFRHTSGTIDYRERTVGFSNGRLYPTLLMRKDYQAIPVTVSASGSAISYGTASAEVFTPPTYGLTASGLITTDGSASAKIPIPITASGTLTTNSTVAGAIVPALSATASSLSTTNSFATVNTHYSVTSTGNASISPLGGSVDASWIWCIKSTTGKATVSKSKADLRFIFISSTTASAKSKAKGIARASIKRNVKATSGRAKSLLVPNSIMLVPVTASAHATTNFYQRIRISASFHTTTDGLLSGGQYVHCEIASASGHFQVSKYDEIFTQIIGVCTAGGHSVSGSITRGNRIFSTRSASGKATTFSTKAFGYIPKTLSATAQGISIVSGFARSPDTNELVVRASARARSYPYCNADCRSHLYFLAWRKLWWNPTEGAAYYDIYRCDQPGESYYKIGTAPQQPKPNYRVEVDLRPVNLAAQRIAEGIRLDWDRPPIEGYPMTFKPVPVNYSGVPMFTPAPDNQWVTDVLPIGASWIDQTGLETSAFRRHGNISLKLTATNGYVEPKFSGASSTIPGGNYIIIWVYLERESTPDTFWCSFYDGNNWEHRFYWGNDLCPFGEIGEPSKMYAEELPVPGLWTPLIVNTSDINISEISGMSFGMVKQNGSASMYIDGVCYTNQPIVKMAWPHIGLHPYETYHIHKEDKLYAKTTATEFLDTDISNNLLAMDGSSYVFEKNLTENKVTISWSIPSDEGVTYSYSVASMDTTGALTDFVDTSIYIPNDYDHTEITISSPSTQPFVVEASGYTYEHTDVILGETYHYVFVVYNTQGIVVSTVEKDYTVPYGSVLGHFKLGKSVLV